ncbi:unnamed protein product [Rhizophagus irregularis]|nr:unnamed protein product [Rhizophagus irregularis]
MLFKHYKDLYPPTGILCPICLNTNDSNSHLGFCDDLHPFLNNTLMEHIPILVALISSHTVKDNMIKFIPDSVFRSDLFQTVSNDSHIFDRSQYGPSRTL